MDSQSPEQEIVAEFVATTLAEGQVWSLRDEEGWALAISEEDEEQFVMPFWSSPDGASQCARDEWEGFEVEGVSLNSFISDWLPGMAEDNYAIGLDWEADASGTALTPAMLLEAFEPFLEDDEDGDEDDDYDDDDE